jgi:5'(3')-deoxyribonucleotidase
MKDKFINHKKILYVDMDNVLVDFKSGIEKISKKIQIKYRDKLDEVPGIFRLMKPMPLAIKSYKKLIKKYDVYILSTAP